MPNAAKANRSAAKNRAVKPDLTYDQYGRCRLGLGLDGIIPRLFLLLVHSRVNPWRQRAPYFCNLRRNICSDQRTSLAQLAKAFVRDNGLYQYEFPANSVSNEPDRGPARGVVP